MIACPQSLYIIAGETSNSYLDVYSGFLIRQQQLGYLHKTAKSIDCSSNYLVSIDTANYLAINYYDSVKISLPPWAIGVIAAVGGLIIIAVVVAVIVCYVKKKRAGMNG